MVSKPTSNYPAVSIHNGEVLVKQQTEGEVISTSRLVQQSERSREKLSLSFHNQDHVFNTDDDLMTNEKVQHSVGQRGGTQNSPVDHSKKHLRVGLNQTVLADDSGNTLLQLPTKRLCMRKSSDSIFGQRHHNRNEDNLSEREDKTDPNAETAWAVGLNATRIADEEKGLLPVNVDQGQYARVRNQILAAWRSNVSQFISEKQAISLSSCSDKAYALAAWRFLHTMGYINFGISDEINQQMNMCHGKKGTVLVVGAGCAGLAAARQLRMLGYQAVVVEGRDRPGGRVHTKRMQGPGISAVADLGGSIITGIDGNPLAAVVKQQGIHMLDIRTETPLFMSDGIEADDELDQLIEERHNFLLDECSRIRDAMNADASDVSLGNKLEELWKKHVSPYLEEQLKGNKADISTARKLFDWHLANLEFANASLVPTLSLKFWDQDDPNELLGAHTFVPGGNFRWVEELCRGIPVYYNSEVSQICYGTSGVAVYACGRIFKADAAIVTVPLGVLKRDRILFNPPLTQRKKAAISRLGFGVLNKVIMLFPFAFWSNEVDMFGRVSDTVDGRGEGFLFYSYASISGGALLIGLVAGKAALMYESLTPGQATARLMDILRSIYEPRGVNVPAPLEVVCTKWGTDPMCYGAYSSMAVGTGGGEDYDILGESLGGRVYFAGEATTNKYPATMHGAFYSGLQAAANVHSNLMKLQGCNGPAWKPHNKKSDNIRTQGISALKLSECLGQSDVVKGAVQEVDQHLLIAAQLNELFKEPDVEVDCFASIHIPVEDKLGQKSLLCINPRNKLHGQQRKAPVYMVVETQLALGLMDTSGTDARLALLNSVYDLTFTGRKGLPSDTMALVNGLLQRRNPGMSVHQPVSHQPKSSPVWNTEGQLLAASGALAEGVGSEQFGEAFSKYIIPRLCNSAVTIE